MTPRPPSGAIAALPNAGVADRWRCRAAAAAACLVFAAAPAHASELKAETLEAWARHVAAVERTIDSEQPATLDEPQGTTVDVPGGTIADWRGAVVIPNRSVTEVVDRLVSSPTLPAPEEVAAARVLHRDGDSLHTYMRLVRKVLVTVAYDTEHDVRYTRHSSGLATSRSAATKIAEIGESDRGFSGV